MVPLSPFVISTNVYEVFIAEKTYIVTFLLFIVYKWAIWHISLKICPISAFWERRKWLFILFVISYKQIHMLKTNKMKDFSHEMYGGGKISCDINHIFILEKVLVFISSAVSHEVSLSKKNISGDKFGCLSFCHKSFFNVAYLKLKICKWWKWPNCTTRAPAISKVLVLLIISFP